MFRNILAAGFFIVAGIFLVSGPASSEESLGLWCLEILPGYPETNELINIILTDSGSYKARWIFSDESSFTYDLRKISPGVYSIVDFEQSSGDRIEILPGVLVILDNNGLVAAGDKMAPNEGRLECIKK